MKLLITLLSFTLFVLNANAQTYMLPKFKEMYDAGKYEKLAKKADKIITKDEYKKKGEPYFWKAAALVEVDKEFGFLEKYKGTFKDLIKAYKKGQKYDELGNHFKKFPTLLNDIKRHGHKKALPLFEDEKYSKANIIYERLSDISVDTLAYYQYAKGLLALKNEKEGYEYLANVCALNYANHIDSNEAIPHTYQEEAFLTLTAHLMEQSIIDSAYQIIHHASILFPESDTVRNSYLMVLKNYRLFFYHYNQKVKALKVVVKAANQFPKDERFVELEQAVFVDFAEELITKGKYPFMQSIFQKYIVRPRDPDVEANLYEANRMMVLMMMDHFHKNEVVVSQNILTVMKDVNRVIRTIVIDSMAAFSYEKMIEETVRNLNAEEEYYLSNIFLKFAQLSLPKNERIKEMISSNKTLFNGLNKHFKQIRDKVLSSENPSKEDYIKVFDLALKCNNFELYELMDSALSQYPDNNEIYETCKRFVLSDYELNYVGSKLVKELINNNVIDELKWTGNTKKCKPGKISSSAKTKTINRMNYFRRMARLENKIYTNDDLDKKAQRFAFELHSKFEPSKACKESKVPEDLFFTMAGKPAVEGASILIESGGDSAYAVLSRRLILSPTDTVIGLGSTNENIVLISGGTPAPESYEQKAIAWPPNGIMPASLVPRRWSVSHPSADFSKAKVRVKLFGKETPVIKEKLMNDEYGMPTFAFMPEDIIKYAEIDLTYEVIVFNVFLEGQEKATSFRYKVTIVQE